MKSYRKDHYTFKGGLNTEVNQVGEDNASFKEIKNFTLNKDGSIQKRGGVISDGDTFRYEQSYLQQPYFVKFDNPNNTDIKMIVVYQNKRLFFFDANIGIKTEGMIGTYNITPHIVPQYDLDSQTELEVHMSVDNRYLLVVGRYLNSLAIIWDEYDKTPRVEEISLKIRDYDSITGIYVPVTKTTEQDIPYANPYKKVDNVSEGMYHLENNGGSYEKNLEQQSHLSSDSVSTFSWGGGPLIFPSQIKIPESAENSQSILDSGDYVISKPKIKTPHPDTTFTNGSTSYGEGGSKIIEVNNVMHQVNEVSAPVTINSANTVSFTKYNDQIHICIDTPRIGTYPIGEWFDPEAIEQTPHKYYLPKDSDQLRTFGQDIGDFETPLKCVTTLSFRNEDNFKYYYFQDANSNPFEIEGGETYSYVYDKVNRKDKSMYTRNTGVYNEYVLVHLYEGDFDVLFDPQEYKQQIIDKYQAEDMEYLQYDNVDDKILIYKFRIQADKDALRLDIEKTFEPARRSYYDLNYSPSQVVDEIVETKEFVGAHELGAIWDGARSVVVGTDNFIPDRIVCKFQDERTLKVVVHSRLNIVEGEHDEDVEYYYLQRDRLHPNKQGKQYPDQNIEGDWVNLNTLPEYTEPYNETITMLGYNEAFSRLKIYLRAYSLQPIVHSTEQYRPEVSTFFANRAWYTGWKSENFSNYIFFTQLIEGILGFGDCYSVNDPNDPDFNQALPTDGGFIVLNDQEKVRALVPYKDYLVVFSDKSCSVIFGNPYFTGDNYSIKRIAELGILNQDAWTIAEDKLIFASESGLQEMKINNDGIFEIKNMTDIRVKDYYTSLEDSQLENCKLNYNPYTKTVSLLHNNNKSFLPDRLESALIYDYELDSFYIHQYNLQGEYEIVDFYKANDYNEDSPTAYLVYNNSDGSYGVYNESKNTHKDFDITSNPFPCVVETNYLNYGTLLEGKRINQLFFFGDNGNNSECYAYVKYDTSFTDDTKWSKPQDIFRLQDKTKSTVVESRQSCRGEGLFVRFRLENNTDRSAHILGYSTDIRIKGDSEGRQ